MKSHGKAQVTSATGLLPDFASPKTDDEQTRIKGKLIARLLAEGWTEDRAEKEAESWRIDGCVLRGQFVFTDKATDKHRKKVRRMLNQLQSDVALFKKLRDTTDQTKLSQDEYREWMKFVTFMADQCGEDPSEVLRLPGRRGRNGGSR